MNNQRLTEEEVNEFKPSYENPLSVMCDDGKYIDGLRSIEIISPVKNGLLAIVNAVGNICTVSRDILGHYPSQKQPREVILYEHVSIYHGDVRFFTEDCKSLDFNEGVHHHAQKNPYNYRKIKNGRKLRLDLNTGEVEEITNEDLR